MAIHAAVIYINKENAAAAFRKAIRTPFLTWMAESLRELDITRIVLVCPPELQEQAKKCIPEDMLHRVFPSKDEIPMCAECAGKEVLVLPQPCVYCGDETVPAGAYLLDREKLGRENEEDCRFVKGFEAAPDAEMFPEFALWLCGRKLASLQTAGVVIWDSGHTYVGPSVKAGAGTEILPGCILYGNTVIGENCTVGPNTMLEDSIVGNGTSVNSSQLYEAVVGENTTVGPFAYVRPGSCIGNDCRVGDFVEVKNSNIGNGTKISHLTYVGDSDVGERVNFGCGTVTVNYDRVHKYRTVIGDDCFIGCNTNLVAPVTLESNVYTAAGSTITKNVPENALAFARAPQKNVDNWASMHKLKTNK